MAAISNIGYAVYGSASTLRAARIDILADALRCRLGHENAITRYVDAIRVSGLADRREYVSAILWRLQFAGIEWGVTKYAATVETKAVAGQIEPVPVESELPFVGVRGIAAYNTGDYMQRCHVRIRFRQYRQTIANRL